MKTYEEKRKLLCDLAELYLDNLDNSYINVNDGDLNSNDFDSISFLMLMALVFSKEEANFYAKDFEIDFDSQKSFIDNEYKKIINSKLDILEKGKKILDDARTYYNDNCGIISNEEINEIAKDLENMGFHI